MKIINSKVPIMTPDSQLYSSCTFDGTNYYFTEPKTNQIHIFDKQHNYISKINVNKSYNNIVYNSNENLFYLSVENNIDSIFSVDKEFKKRKEIFINTSKKYRSNINSMYYSENEKMLYLVSKDSIVSLGEGPQNIKVFNKNEKLLPKTITEFTAVSYINDEIYIAYNKGKRACLGKIDNEKIVEEVYIDDSCIINNIINEDKEIKLFVIKSYNYIYGTNIEIKEENRSWVLDSSDETCEECSTSDYDDSEDYLEEYSTCHKSCSDKNCKEDYKHNCKPKCEYDCDCECSICEIIESIALEEAGISHLLNTEAQKLQKIIANTDDINELLKANESINRIIINITILEQILYGKLELVLCNLVDSDKSCNECNFGDRGKNCNLKCEK